MSETFSMHALRTGTLPVVSSFALFGTSDTRMIDLGFYVWIISDGTTTGLIDTGLPLDQPDLELLCEEDAFRDVHLLPELLQQAGFAGADIDFVVVTQTVSYHTGGIDAELLPRAQFYISLAGVTELLNEPPGHPVPPLYFTARGWSALRQLAIEGRLHCVDAPTEIVPGVVFETTGGHHPGSAAVRIRTAAGIIGVLETAFLQQNLDRMQPIGICEDVAAARSAMRRYLRECDDVIAIHEPSNATRFPLDRFAQKRMQGE